MTSRRCDTDERGRGVADARASLPAIQQLVELAGSEDWVAEDPETHLLPGLRERVGVSGLAVRCGYASALPPSAHDASCASRSGPSSGVLPSSPRSCGRRGPTIGSAS